MLFCFAKISKNPQKLKTVLPLGVTPEKIFREKSFFANFVLKSWGFFFFQRKFFFGFFLAFFFLLNLSPYQSKLSRNKKPPTSQAGIGFGFHLPPRKKILAKCKKKLLKVFPPSPLFWEGVFFFLQEGFLKRQVFALFLGFFYSGANRKKKKKEAQQKAHPWKTNLGQIFFLSNSHSPKRKSKEKNKSIQPTKNQQTKPTNKINNEKK